MSFNPQGWYGTANRRESPNLYRTPNPREIIVMHYTAGYQASSAINHFLQSVDRPASAHFVVDVDGSVTQMVSTNHCAWHAGYGIYDGREKVNTFSIGIEIVNPGYHYRRPDGTYLNWERKPIPANALASYTSFTEAHDPWVSSASVWWPDFADSQLDAVEQLTRDLIAAYPSIRDIVGHRDVDTKRRLKVDPGPAFPLRRFRMLLDRRDDAPPSRLRVLTAGSPLNVRGGPDTSFPLLSWGPLPNGSTVNLLEHEGDWARIALESSGNTQEGWVYARYTVPA